MTVINKKIKSLLKLEVFTSKDARKAGVPTGLVAYYVNKGIITRLSRGLYRSSEIQSAAPFEWEDLLATSQGIHLGTICVVSALSYYGLTLEVQRQFWIAVPHEMKAPRRKNTKIIRMRNFKLGRIGFELGEYKTFIYDKERCVLDAFRFLSRESAIKVLKEYLKGTSDKKADIPKLSKYAKTLRVDITPYLEALI